MICVHVILEHVLRAHTETYLRVRCMIRDCIVISKVSHLHKKLLDRPVGTRPSLLEITVGPQVLLGVRIEHETTMLTCAVQHKPNSRKD